MKYYFFPLLIFACTNAVGQNADSGQFIIHRHLKIVGKETYQLKSMADGTQTYSIDCFYADRGKDVPLKTTMVLSASGEPMQMISKGFTSKMSQINDTVTINRDSLVIKKDSTTLSHPKPANMFPADGYAPATMQGLLVKWWIKNGKPSQVNGLFGSVEIRFLGVDTIQYAGGNKILSAIGIKNVIWGWEFLWIDQQGELVALCTINAGLDKIEFIRPDYEDQLNFFARKSAIYGVEQYIAKTKVPVNLPSAIIHGVLVDMEKGTELPDAAIIIINGKISWTGPTNQAVIPPNATVIDAKGRRMLPGLWDMHAHLKQVEWGPAYIAAGITTARDMANEFDFINTMKSSIDEGKGVGPTILRAGIIDGPGALANGINIAETAEQGVAFVKKYKAAGFEQVKIYSSLQPAVIKAVCDEAHRQGLSVAGHIPKSITTIQGVEMGIDMIAHISYLMMAFEADSSFMVNLDLPVNQKALQKILANKTVVDPTLALYELIFHPLHQSMETIEPAFNTLPATLQGVFTSMGLPSTEAIRKVPVLKGYQKLIFQLYKAGVPIVAGTDMIIPGYSLYRELELYVAAGLTPLEALQCATTTPAWVMGLLSSTGSLKKGKDADIILVDGNPLTQISDIRKISLILKAGRLYDPAELRRMIGFGLSSPATQLSRLH